MKALVPTVAFFSGLRDPETGMDFFGPGWRNKLRTCVESILKGYLSDPPHLSIHTCVRVVNVEFDVCTWHCHRGTPGLEGFHANTRDGTKSITFKRGNHDDPARSKHAASSFSTSLATRSPTKRSAAQGSPHSAHRRSVGRSSRWECCRCACEPRGTRAAAPAAGSARHRHLAPPRCVLSCHGA